MDKAGSTALLVGHESNRHLMIYRILVNPGTEQAWEINLKPGVNRIGSSAESDFTINHPSLSPRHCELLVSDTGVLLKDLGSQGGTFVNAAPVREVWLQSGEHIQLGAIEMVFESRQTPSSPPPVNQPAPGATVIVAAIGPAPTTERFGPSGASVEPLRTDLGTSAISSPASSSESSGHSKTFPVHRPAEREATRRKLFILGLAGAIMGSFVGVFLWFLLTKSTGSPLLVMSWGVGGLTGLGARLLTKRGGLPLGAASAICALLAIIGGECLAAKAIRDQEVIKRSVAAYRSQLEFAKEALRAETPEDFQKLLARVNKLNAEEITDEQIRKFREEEMPALRNFALGKPSKAEFSKEMGDKFTAEFDYKEFFLHEDVKSGLFMALFAVLGIATAYKAGSGEDEQA